MTTANTSANTATATWTNGNRFTTAAALKAYRVAKIADPSVATTPATIATPTTTTHEDSAMIIDNTALRVITTTATKVTPRNRYAVANMTALIRAMYATPVVYPMIDAPDWGIVPVTIAATQAPVVATALPALMPAATNTHTTHEDTTMLIDTTALRTVTFTRTPKVQAPTGRNYYHIGMVAAINARTNTTPVVYATLDAPSWDVTVDYAVATPVVHTMYTQLLLAPGVDPVAPVPTDDITTATEVMVAASYAVDCIKYVLYWLTVGVVVGAIATHKVATHKTTRKYGAMLVDALKQHVKAQMGDCNIRGVIWEIQNGCVGELG